MKIRNWLAAGIVVITTLALAGCGGKGKEENVPEAAESAKDDFIYVAEYETLGEEGYMVGNVMSGDEGTIYFVGGKDNQTKLFVRKMDGSQEEIPVDLAENTVISVIGKDTEGNLLLGLETYDQLGGMESKTENVTIRSEEHMSIWEKRWLRTTAFICRVCWKIRTGIIMSVCRTASALSNRMDSPIAK